MCVPSRELPWLGGRFVVWTIGFASSQRQAIAYRVNYRAQFNLRCHHYHTLSLTSSHHLKMPSASNQKRVKVPSRLSDIRIRVRFLLCLFFPPSLCDHFLFLFVARVTQAHILTNGCCGLLFGLRSTLLLGKNYRVFLFSVHSVCLLFFFFVLPPPPSPLTINCSIWLRRHSRKPRQEAAESPGRPHASMDCVR